MSSTAPRVGIYGLHGSGNLGNDGSLEVVLDWLRRDHPNAVIDAICDGPDGVTAEWGIPAMRLHWNRQEYQTANDVRSIARKAIGKIVDAARIGAWVRRHDVVLMAGMGAFEATLPLRPWGTPYSQYLITALGRRAGTKVALLSVGANLVAQPSIRRLFVATARRLHYLSYRDSYSQESMRTMGLPERGDHVQPDLVWAMATPPVPAGRTGVIGVGVLDFHGGNDDRARADEVNARYVADITTLVHTLLDAGHGVRLLIGDQKDRPVVTAILDDVRRRRPDDLARVHADPVTSLHELMRQMAGTDAVIATRFHNIICALKLGKPTVSVGYAMKNDAIMDVMGLGAYCHQADGFDPALVTQQVLELLDREPELHEAMAERAEALKNQVADQFDLLDSMLFLANPRSRRVRSSPAATQRT